jgi:hypothetical protein
MKEMKEFLTVELVEVEQPRRAADHWLLHYIDHENRPCELKIPFSQGLRLLSGLHSICVEFDIVPPPTI